jgi:hypothetical protein
MRDDGVAGSEQQAGRSRNGLCVRLLRVLLIAALLWPAPLSVTKTQAAAQVADEPSLKAAFIYHFAKFTTWPAEAFNGDGKTISFCIIGKHELGEAFDKTLSGKKVAGRPVEVKYLERLKKDDVCNVIYVAPSEKSRVKKIVETSAVGHALTISDLDGFADDGGMIRLVKVNETIKFEINPKAAQQAGLKLSSALLDLAIRLVN